MTRIPGSYLYFCNKHLEPSQITRGYTFTQTGPGHFYRRSESTTFVRRTVNEIVPEDLGELHYGAPDKDITKFGFVREQPVEVLRFLKERISIAGYKTLYLQFNQTGVIILGASEGKVDFGTNRQHSMWSLLTDKSFLGFQERCKTAIGADLDLTIDSVVNSDFPPLAFSGDRGIKSKLWDAQQMRDPANYPNFRDLCEVSAALRGQTTYDYGSEIAYLQQLVDPELR